MNANVQEIKERLYNPKDSVDDVCSLFDVINLCDPNFDWAKEGPYGDPDEWNWPEDPGPEEY